MDGQVRRVKVWYGTRNTYIHNIVRDTESMLTCTQPPCHGHIATAARALTTQCAAASARWLPDAKRGAIWREDWGGVHSVVAHAKTA